MVHCRNCSTLNQSNVSECRECGADLLPAEGKTSRIAKLVILSLMGIALAVVGIQLKIDDFTYGCSFIGLLLLVGKEYEQ